MISTHTVFTTEIETYTTKSGKFSYYFEHYENNHVVVYKYNKAGDLLWDKCLGYVDGTKVGELCSTARRLYYDDIGTDAQYI